MTWTTSADIKQQLQKLWDRGSLLTAITDESLFPCQLRFKAPNSRELSERFAAVREWIAELSAQQGLYRIEWRNVNHRVLGTNQIPAAIWIDNLAAALSLLGKQKAAQQFADMLAMTSSKQPELLPWLNKRPLRALELSADWAQFLAIVAWLRKHPRPAIYLRQLDLPNVHSKFIEKHRGVLAELFDLVLPEIAIDKTYTGAGGFCARYGFLSKPSLVRFRILDANIRLLPTAVDADISLSAQDFATLDLPVAKIFITENEINFLAFPRLTNALVIFGAGYGFANLAAASWLHAKAIYYWGDIDTHGFAILNQLRGLLPHAVSILMNQSTLSAHKNLWGVEQEPQTATLARLTASERELYQQLCHNHWGEKVRLEQERIGFDFLKNALQNL